MININYESFINNILSSRPNEYFQYSERHHIIPRCLGGTDDKDNLIYLTPKEHFLAHKLLVEQNPDNKKLIFAMRWMAGRLASDCTPDDYEYARTKYIESITGVPRSDEIKKKISESHKGKHHSEETKIKLAILAEGSKRSATTRMKMSTNHADFSGVNHPGYGKSRTAETRAKISLANLGNKNCLGRKLSDKTKLKISIANIGNQNTLGYHHTEDSKRKIAESNRNRKISDETRKKISEAHKGFRYGPRKYHCVCILCNSEFLGSSPRSSKCQNCLNN